MGLQRVQINNKHVGIGMGCSLIAQVMLKEGEVEWESVISQGFHKICAEQTIFQVTALCKITGQFSTCNLSND